VYIIQYTFLYMLWHSFDVDAYYVLLL
jgi:hypothetical protein